MRMMFRSVLFDLVILPLVPVKDCKGLKAFRLPRASSSHEQSANAVIVNWEFKLAKFESLKGLQAMFGSKSHKSLVRTACVFAVWLGCGSVVAEQLPADILADRYVLQAEQQIAE